MKTMGISQFKAQALKILDLIAKSHESLIVTKRGKPLVQINPCGSKSASAQPGRPNRIFNLDFQPGLSMKERLTGGSLQIFKCGQLARAPIQVSDRDQEFPSQD